MPRKISTVRAISQIETWKPCVSRPSQPGRRVEVEVAEERVRGELEDRVQHDEHGRRLPVAAGEVVPDHDHRDAAREPDDDQTGAVRGLVGQQQPREREHQRRADEPVEDERRAEQAPLAAQVAELLVADAREDRVHHHEQPERDRQRHRPDLHPLEIPLQAGDESPEPETRGHRHADPERQEPVERREARDDRGVRFHRRSRHAQQHPARAAGWITGRPFAAGSDRLDRLHDRAVHPVGDLVRELDRDLLEPGRGEPGLVLADRERAGDAADVAAALRALGRRDPVLGDDVADAEPPAGAQDARDLGQHRRLVGREVDDAVRDHDVDGVRRQRDLLDHALEEVDVRGRRPPPRSGARARASRRSCRGRRRCRPGRRASRRGSRRCRRPSRGRARSRPRAGRRRRSGCRSRARRGRPRRAARRAARRCRGARRTGRRASRRRSRRRCRSRRSRRPPRGPPRRSACGSARAARRQSSVVMAGTPLSGRRPPRASRRRPP